MRRVAVAGLLFLAAALTPLACFTPQQETTLYHLVPSGDGDAVAPGDDGLTLGLGSVVIPRYLDRPQLVTRLEGNQVRLEVFHQWAEPLQSNLERVLADDLLVLTGAKRVLRAPYRHPSEIDLRIGVEIIRFEGTEQGDCMLSAEWVISGKGDEALRRRRSRFTGRASGEGIPAVVACLSGLLGELGRAVAGDVTAVAGR
ncbi:MAG: PqiC family protein [Planctomycetota bacterium]